ncbi:HAMP domain-containing sensor histidine kinase [Bdellovibrionota bacterium FG-1]
MITTKLFRRHYAITAAVTIFFVVIGLFITNAVMRFAISRQQGFPHGPQVFYAHLIDDLSPTDRSAALRRIERLGLEREPFRLAILDQDGKDISTGQPVSIPWEKVQKPQEPFQSAVVGPNNSSGGFAGPPGPPIGNELVRFPGNPAQYLYVTMSWPEHFEGGRPPVLLFFITFGSLLLSVLIGVAFALLLLFRSMTERMRLADEVISELQSGNLKARFPVRRMDELGQAMTRFNLMADEIERLVEQMRNVEKSRVSLLQDLTHDLRTPVASLKNLLATLGKKSPTVNEQVREELIELAEREVDYFERLVEDLLVLAQIREPRYQADRRSVSVLEIIQEEAESVSVRSKTAGAPQKTIDVDDSISPEACEISGDAHLLRRLFRNALENAYSFALSEVKVSFDISHSKELRIRIQDDGPGMSAEALKGFGERRVTRNMAREKGNRLSVGLGSVIMKTITEIHRGGVVARNHEDAAHRILGADIQIVLPRQ